MYRKISTLIFILFFVRPAFSYVVQQGDTLALIVKKFYTVAPFGKNGGVAKLVQLNKGIIKNPDAVPPGTMLRLNKELLKPGIVDNNDGTQDDSQADNEEENDSAQGLNPYIEVEKYNDPANTFKYSDSDKLNFFVSFQFNNFEAKDRNTLATTDFSTSTDSDVGLQYVFHFTENLSLLASATLNEYSISDIAAFNPSLVQSEKSQATGSLGIRYAFDENNLIDANINYYPHYYLVQNPDGHLNLEHTLSPSISGAMQNYFYHAKEAAVGLDLGFEIITNTQSSGLGSTNGFGYNAGLIYQQQFKTGDYVSAKLDYRSSTMDTSLFTLTDQSYSVGFSYTFPF